jgi:CheY-like chemotaxis protein
MAELPDQLDLASIDVLIVEDNGPMRQLVATMLRSFGVREVLHAIDGNEALSVLSRRRVDLIICDWLMEPMNGFEFVRALRARPQDGALPVIMLTGEAEQGRVTAARDIGVTEYLIKPVSSKRLLTRVLSVLTQPRPVVATAAYVGPDRRRRVDDGYRGPLRRASDGAARAARVEGFRAAVAQADSSLSALADGYRDLLADDVADIEQLAAQIGAAAWDDEHTWRRLYRRSHDVKGQAGTFGYRLVTEIAASLCQLLRPVVDQFDRRTDRVEAYRTAIDMHLQALKVVVGRDMRGDGGAEGASVLRVLANALSRLRGGQPSAARGPDA